MTQRVTVVENILNANDRLAEENHARIKAAGVFSINIMASPGAGKTSLIEQTLPRLKDKLRVATIDAHDHVKYTPITIERDTGATLWIASGLTGDERIVKIAVPSLLDGDPVDVPKTEVTKADGSGSAK